MSERNRIVVTDVATNPYFSDYLRGLVLRAKVRSLQSTPLIDSAGKLIGVVSTHYSYPGGFLPQMGKKVDDLAAQFVAKINAG